LNKCNVSTVLLSMLGVSVKLQQHGDEYWNFKHS